MRKIFSFIVLTLTIGLVSAGIWVFDRYQKNPEQIVPWPYAFEQAAPAFTPEAPILITGDRMGAYFAKFKEELAATISQNLANSIKIQSIAKEGNGLHRTLHELRSLTQWPQILIYQGASEEFAEVKFDQSSIKKIGTNFKLYTDDRVETMLILWPWLSRFLYEPINQTRLAKEPVLMDKFTEQEYLKRLETELLLFEQQLIQLVSMAKDRNTLLVLTTTPINLDVMPKRVCEFTSNLELEKEILGLKELLKANDPKTAYARSSKLVKQHLGNADLYYIHGQISRRLGLLDEAKVNLLEASAYDCEPWRVTEVHNSIIRKIAKDRQVLLFDFARLVEKDFGVNTTFFDDIHPQNLYYDKGMHQLGMVIKAILKL